VRIGILQRELENLTHTLSDLTASYDCVEYSIKKAMRVQEHLKPRIDRLKQRVDKITIEIGNLERERV
jgi:chromosome segregation ATPase